MFETFQDFKYVSTKISTLLKPAFFSKNFKEFEECLTNPSESSIFALRYLSFLIPWVSIINVSLVT